MEHTIGKNLFEMFGNLHLIINNKEKKTPIISHTFPLAVSCTLSRKQDIDFGNQGVYINTLKQELNGTKAYEETSIDGKSVVYNHSNEIPNKFAVDVKERQDRLPTMYWLSQPHKRPYKARFIANSSS